MSGLGDNLGKYLHPAKRSTDPEERSPYTKQHNIAGDFSETRAGRRSYGDAYDPNGGDSLANAYQGGRDDPVAGEDQPSRLGDRLRPRLNVQRLKPKAPEQTKESADDAEVLRTRAGLIGTRD